MMYIILSLISAVTLELFLHLFTKSSEIRARIVETLFAFTIGISALTSAFINIAQNLPLANGISDFGRITLLSAIGFFTYHLHRVIFVPGFTRGLIIHHVGMLICLIAGILVNIGYFYILLGCIPIASAGIRNIRWFIRTLQFSLTKTATLIIALIYVIIETIPPLTIFIHFFLIGMFQIKLPTFIWPLMVWPGLILTLLTIYWSAAFIKKATFA